MGKKDYTIKLLRVIATLLVVFGHSNFYLISTEIHGLGYDISMNIVDHSKFWTIASYLIGLIYTCHMQLFFAISGYVFSLCIANKKYKNYKELTIAKFCRLIIPYFFVTLLYNLPILLYANYFSHNLQNVLLYFIGYGKNHLWYLVALFFVFLITYAFLNFMEKLSAFDQKISFIVVFLGALFICFLIECGIIKVTEFMYLDRTLKYFVWFLFGMILRETYYFFDSWKFKEKQIRCSIVTLFFSWAVLYLNCHNRLVSVLTSFLGVLFFYESCFYIEMKYKIAESNKLIDLIDKYSFEIYLYGVPLNYLILTILVDIYDKVELNNVQSILLFLTRFFVQIFGGIAIGKLIGSSQIIIKRVKTWV